MSRDLEAWFAFLEEECQKPNGLLCFYERPQLVRLECIYDLSVAMLGLDAAPWEKGRFPSKLAN